MSSREIFQPQQTAEQFAIGLRKGDQWWLFQFTDATRTQVLGQLGKMAADPRLEFSWYDSAILAKKVRETAEGS